MTTQNIDNVETPGELEDSDLMAVFRPGQDDVISKSLGTLKGEFDASPSAGDAVPEDVVTGTGSAGDAVTYSRSNHVHGGAPTGGDGGNVDVNFSEDTPEQISAGAGAVGTSDDVPRADHVHSLADLLSDDTPSSVGSGSAGSSTDLSRADHSHAGTSVASWAAADNVDAIPGGKLTNYVVVAEAITGFSGNTYTVGTLYQLAASAFQPITVFNRFNNAPVNTVLIDTITGYVFYYGGQVSGAPGTYNFTYMGSLKRAGSDWNETDNEADGYIANKPVVPSASDTTTVLAESASAGTENSFARGDHAHPYVQSDWAIGVSNDARYIANKPTIPLVAEENPESVGPGNRVGMSNRYAREDHVHEGLTTGAISAAVGAHSTDVDSHHDPETLPMSLQFEFYGGGITHTGGGDYTGSMGNEVPANRFIAADGRAVTLRAWYYYNAEDDVEIEFDELAILTNYRITMYQGDTVLATGVITSTSALSYHNITKQASFNASLSVRVVIAPDPIMTLSVSGTTLSGTRVSGQDDLSANLPIVQFAYQVNNSATAPVTPTSTENDLPTGWAASGNVSASSPYLWAISRSGNTDNWGNWSNPFLFGHYGRDGSAGAAGAAGDGVQLAFQATDSGTAPATPTGTANDLPSGWATTASVDDTNDHLWAIIRTGKADAWNAWSDPFLVGHHGADGADGSGAGGGGSVDNANGVDIAFQATNSSTAPSRPTSTANGNPSGWTDTANSSSSSPYLWATIRYGVTDDWEDWSNPFLIGHYGRDGVPGTPGLPGATGSQGAQGDAGDSVEFAYRLTSTSDDPDTPSGTANDIPDGWGDPDSVSDSNQYLWAIKRTGRTDNWSTWSDPFLVGYYGVDGEDGAAGATGAQGIQGERGAAGADGAAGAQGDTGPAGADGNDGTNGTDGDDGDDGWTPILASAVDGERRLIQVTGWTGGGGTAPGTGYLGTSGLVTSIGSGTDFRGEAGESIDDRDPRFAFYRIAETQTVTVNEQSSATNTVIGEAQYSVLGAGSVEADYVRVELLSVTGGGSVQLEVRYDSTGAFFRTVSLEDGVAFISRSIWHANGANMTYISWRVASGSVSSLTYKVDLIKSYGRLSGGYRRDVLSSPKALSDRNTATGGQALLYYFFTARESVPLADVDKVVFHVEHRNPFFANIIMVPPCLIVPDPSIHDVTVGFNANNRDETSSGGIVYNGRYGYPELYPWLPCTIGRHNSFVDDSWAEVWFEFFRKTSDPSDHISGVIIRRWDLIVEGGRVDTVNINQISLYLKEGHTLVR